MKESITKWDPVIRAKCGSRTGWTRHVNEWERPCDACYTWNRENKQYHRILAGQTKSITVPIQVLLDILYYTGSLALKNHLTDGQKRALAVMQERRQQDAQSEDVA